MVTVVAVMQNKVILTGFYPDDGHQVKKDFGVLLSQNSTDDRETSNS